MGSDMYLIGIYICDRLAKQEDQRPHTCCNKQPVKRGMWTPDEDEKLQRFMLNYVTRSHSWTDIPTLAGLQRCGDSCRSRWTNHLRPGLKGGDITEQEAKLIHHLHKTFGNKWADIASQLPGRTGNDVKNYWRSKRNTISSSSAGITTSVTHQNNYQIKNPNDNNNPQLGQSFTLTLESSNNPVTTNFETGDFSPMPPPPKSPVIIDVEEENNVDVKITPAPEVNVEMRLGFSEPAAAVGPTNDVAGSQLELVVPEHDFPDDITEVPPLEPSPPLPDLNYLPAPEPAPADWTFIGVDTSFPIDQYDWGLD